MVFNGQDFYKNFFCKFQEKYARNPKQYDKTTTDALWTSYVKAFLSELASDLGFNETTHEDIYKIDSTWKRTADKFSIAIEHENDEETVWEKEVPNLLKTSAPLKVLVTYVRNDVDFPGEHLSNKLLKILKDELRGDQEFLLILGSCSMKKPSDWVGYLYKQEVVAKTLVFCSTMLEAEKSPGRKAWITRKSSKETKT